MMVKDMAGNEFNAASNGKANAGLTLGIIGTSLAALSGGLANNFLSGNSNNDCLVSERKYYEDTIGNLKEFFSYAQGVSDRICALEQRMAVDETSISKNFDFMTASNDWQNKFFDEKMRYADLLEKCRIEDATCKCIKGEVYASPSDLANPYVGRQYVLGSYQMPFCNDCGYNFYNNGCGCNF